MTAETSVVIALFFIGFLFVSAMVYSSVDYYKNLVKNAQYEQDTMKKAKIQTDITIINMTNSSSRLNITLKNTGRVTLNSSLLDVFVDGVSYPYNLTTVGYVWPPQNKMNITIPVTVSTGSRIKVVAENGISDYALVP